jgi:hypothetical protein
VSVVKLNYPVSGKKMPHLFTNFCLQINIMLII